MTNEVSFKISSYLKNLLGKDLITDRYIAVQELVKNSRDADAKEVDIIFNQDSIEIIDNGYWMNEIDIREKRLFLWYSSKSYIDENGEIQENNIRKNKKRQLSWAKWVWRLACDKLWKELVMYSKKEGGSEIKLQINRTNFESNMKTEFHEIKGILEISKENRIESSWTILIIKQLREERWNSEVIKLRKQLQKMISPLPNLGDDELQIELMINELQNEHRDGTKALSWPIVNDALEKITKYTTFIELNTNNDTTSINIYDRDRFLLSYSKNNSFKHLKNITLKLYYLNITAKQQFSKLTGDNLLDYWSIFVYKNSIRIYPYGNEGDDSFRLDKRKQQWYSRYLWTRELLWYVDIEDSENMFIEKTSRDWWFIENQATNELNEFVMESVKILEALVVKAMSRTEKKVKIDENADDTDENIKIIQSFEIEDKLDEVKWFLRTQLKESKVENFTIWEEFVEFFQKKDLVADLREKVKWTWAEKTAEKIIKKLHDAQLENQELEWKTEILINENKKLETEIEYIDSQKDKLLENQNIDVKEVRMQLHDLKNITNWLKYSFENLFEKIWYDDRLKSDILSIKNYIDQTELFITYYTKNDFVITNKKEDIVSYIAKRIKIICESYKMRITVIWLENIFITTFNTIDIQSVLMNLIDNSSKAWSKNIELIFTNKWLNLYTEIIDDGKWIEKENIDRIFDFHYSTTYGLWIWLTHVKEILAKNSASIELKSNNNSKWAAFLISFTKK